MDAKTRRVTAHLTPATIEAASSADSLSAGLNRIADRYRAMVASVHIEEMFSGGEWVLIRTALVRWTAETADAIKGVPARAVAEALSAAPDFLGPKLLSKLSALTYVDEVALVDAVERYWKGVGDGVGSEGQHG